MAVTIVVYVSAASPRHAPAPELVGAGSVALLLIALLTRWPSFIPGGVALLAAAYALSLGGGVDGAAVLVAPALLLVAELAYWSLEAVPIRVERSVLAGRFSALGIVAASTAVTGALLLSTTALAVAGRAVLVAAGVLAATGALALSAKLARRDRSADG